MESRQRPAAFRRESSVRHLQQLYTIVAGLALSDAIATLVEGSDSGWRDPLSIMLLIAFLVTLVPFFHGALRHFDETYLVPEGQATIGRASLAVDFGFLFVESGLLFGLAHQIKDANVFGVLLAALLFVDIAWVVAISGASAEGRSFWQELLVMATSPKRSVIAQQHWAANNIRYLLVLIVCTWTAHLLWPAQETIMGIIILSTAIARTAWDYHGSFSFYFPE